MIIFTPLEAQFTIIKGTLQLTVTFRIKGYADRGVIYDCNMFIVLATCVNFINILRT
jgi:hypothetical protein